MKWLLLVLKDSGQLAKEKPNKSWRGEAFRASDSSALRPIELLRYNYTTGTNWDGWLAFPNRNQLPGIWGAARTPIALLPGSSISNLQDVYMIYITSSCCIDWWWSPGTLTKELVHSGIRKLWWQGLVSKAILKQDKSCGTNTHQKTSKRNK